MNNTQRASHPSRAQIETLLDFLERNPSLAKGFSRVPSARDATRRLWEQLSLRLNSLGGCVKNWKQWTKYWADKKSAVKKKGALRFRTRNKTGGGAEVVELTDIEERILALMGGEGYAVGDKHLEINPFEDTQVEIENSPTLLTNPVMEQFTVPQSTMEQSTPNIILMDMIDTNIPIMEEPQHIECIAGTSYPSARPSVVCSVSQNLPRTQTPPGTPPRLCMPGPEMPTTPSTSGRYPQHHSTEQSNVRRQLIVSSTPNQPHANRTTPSGRRRRRHLSPPSQRQSRLNSLAERFLQLEEQRTDIFRRYLNDSAERDRSSAQALLAIGEGLKLLAEALKNKMYIYISKMTFNLYT